MDRHCLILLVSSSLENFELMLLSRSSGFHGALLLEDHSYSEQVCYVQVALQLTTSRLSFQRCLGTVKFWRDFRRCQGSRAAEIE